ncbi:hypothetical protein BDAP_001241 [Binucleata daphniae]
MSNENAYSDDDTISCEDFEYQNTLYKENQKTNLKKNITSIERTNTITSSITNINEINKYITQETVTQELITQESAIQESNFINILHKKKEDVQTKIKYASNKIYNNMRVISNKKLEIQKIKYYKFPLYIIHKTENNDWFDFWLHEWKKAFISIYKNFKELKQTFYILYKDCIFEFSNNDVKVDKSIKCMLDENEIVYQMHMDYILVTNIDVAMLFDMLINVNYHKKVIIPFILSYNEFENGCMYYTNIKKETSVLYQNKTSYCYYVEGYFYGSDYKELFDNDIVFDI